MKRSRRTYAVALAAAVAVLGLATSAAPALGAYSFTIGVAGPSTGTVGKPLTLNVSGQNPTPGDPDDYWFSTWLSVDVIPASVASSCPATADEGQQVGVYSGGQGGGYLVVAQRENVDTAGAWSSLVAYTPNVPGRMLICAYSDDGSTNTLARAQHTIEVTASGSAAAKPASVDKPRVTRKGNALACDPGRWSNDPTRYAYGWLVNGRTKKGATARKLGISSKLRGRKVQCRVTASNGAGAATAVSPALRVR